VATLALVLAAAVLATLPVQAARPVPPGVDPEQVKIAAEAILCDCGCHPQSVHDCACGRAEEMWAELAAEVRSGGADGGPLTGEQVIAKWVAARGELILVTPEASGFNLVAWLGPIALLVAAAIILALVLRRWAGRGAPAAAAAGGAPVPEIDPATLDRIRKDVEDLR
jgi:cytochrome c-type biogenesis protein CcmH